MFDVHSYSSFARCFVTGYTRAPELLITNIMMFEQKTMNNFHFIHFSQNCDVRLAEIRGFHTEKKQKNTAEEAVWTALKEVERA